MLVSCRVRDRVRVGARLSSSSRLDHLEDLPSLYYYYHYYCYYYYYYYYYYHYYYYYYYQYLDHLEDLLGLVQEEHLLGRVGHRPEGEDGLDDLVRGREG